MCRDVGSTAEEASRDSRNRFVCNGWTLESTRSLYVHVLHEIPTDGPEPFRVDQKVSNGGGWMVTVRRIGPRHHWHTTRMDLLQKAL